MSPMFTHSNTPTSAKNGTAGTTSNTTTTRAQAMAPTGGNRCLMQIQKASHVAEMTQDGFTLVDRSKTYAAVAASKGAPQRKHQMVTYTKKKTDIDRPATIRGVLTTAINNQRVITTKVTLPEQEMERRKALIKALDKMKLRKVLRSTLIFLSPFNRHYHHASSTSTSTSTSSIASTRSHASSTQSASTHAHQLCLPFTTRGPHSSTRHTAQSHHRQSYPTAMRRTRRYGRR